MSRVLLPVLPDVLNGFFRETDFILLHEALDAGSFSRPGKYWQFSISPNGSLAWNLNPLSGVQRVYMLDLPVVDQE